MLSNQAIEESTLCLLCYSDQYAPLLALKITESRLFTNPTNQRIGQVCLEYISKYSTAPKQALEYILEADLVRGEQGKLIKLELEVLQKQYYQSQVDPNFVIEQLDDFLEIQRLTQSLQSSLEMLGEGSLKEAKERIYKAASVPSISSPEILLQDPKQSLSFLDREEHNDFFSSGIDLLDNLDVRPEKKTVMFLIAATGKGKTFYLVNVGKSGLQHHHKVLHITLELSKEKTSRRYIQSIFSLTKSEAQQVRIPYFTTDQNGTSSFNFQELQRDGILNRRDELKKKLREMTSYPPLYIKEFPPSSLSVEQLYLYLDSLEQHRGFKPDILVLDYTDLMKLDYQSLRIDTGRLYKEIRGLAVSRDIAVVSATQGNRDSETAKLVGSTNVSEDWSKVGTADIVLTYSQTPEEKRLGLARIFVAKARDTGDHFLCLVSQCYELGQFAIQAIPMNASLANQLQNPTQ